MNNPCCELVQGGECHCAACHVTFSNLTLFDRHQVVSYKRRTIRCKSPSKLGLVQNDRGTWYTPEGLAKAQLSATRLATARSGEG